MSPKQGLIVSGILFMIAVIMMTVCLCIYQKDIPLQLQKIDCLILVVSLILMYFSNRKDIINFEKNKKEETEYQEKLSKIFNNILKNN